MHIAWSSSESDVSDSEAKRPAACGAPVRGGPGLQAVPDSYHAYLRMITTITQPQQGLSMFLPGNSVASADIITAG